MRASFVLFAAQSAATSLCIFSSFRQKILMSTMLVRFATLALLLFGSSSPTNGVVAADNIADVVGSVQEDPEIDDFARKVNSPTAAAAAGGGASASHGEVMGHQQHSRVLKEGKGNHRQAMKNDEGHRSLGLFDSKSPKVAPDVMDLENYTWAAKRALQNGDYPTALRYTLKAMNIGTSNAFILLSVALAGFLSEKAEKAYRVSSMDEEDAAKKRFNMGELERVLEEVIKMCKSVTKTIDWLIDDAPDGGLEQSHYLLPKGDCSHATAILGLLAGRSIDGKSVSAALRDAENSYESAYATCIQSDSPETGACLVRAVRLAKFLSFVGKQTKATATVMTELAKLSVTYGLIMIGGRGHPQFDNLDQVIDVATCNHYATFNITTPCDDSCLAMPYVSDSSEQDGGEECCSAAYLLARAMVDKIIEDKGPINDIEVQVALNNELNGEGEIVSSTMSELHMKVATYYEDNSFVPDEVEAPYSEEDVRDIALDSIDSITLPVPTITLEPDYDYEFAVCQESPFHSNTMVVSLVGASPLIDPAKTYLVAGANIGSGSVSENELDDVNHVDETPCQPIALHAAPLSP